MDVLKVRPVEPLTSPSRASAPGNSAPMITPASLTLPVLEPVAVRLVTLVVSAAESVLPSPLSAESASVTTGEKP
ncbi:MAG: hypothetical protein HC866_16060 [Leptolyngbyaceae cyanobacterium RU_5_1]|nr:hypothetical protein [Leptolyngbyaceae cyanobacterium RU_5_1]